MFGSHKARGFTLIEIIIVIAIMAVLALVVVPQLWRHRPAYERNQFVSQLSSLISSGLLEALETQKLHRIYVDLNQKKVRLERATDKKQSSGDFVFEKVARSYQMTEFALPEEVTIKNFYINAHDEMAQSIQTTTKAIWFYLMPDGTSQAVIINAIDMNDLDSQGNPAHMSIVVNPFTLQVEQYASFQKP